VAISSSVIYYDERRESDDGVRRRGQALPVPIETLHGLNGFIDEYGNHPDSLTRPDGSQAQIMVGPVGSGEAVVALADSDIRAFLVDFNDKVLCVETEAGAVAQAYHEAIAGDSLLRGWLTIRGISDRADRAKNDDHHVLAARNAARVMRLLLPALAGPGDYR
jgi:adenosylhomocysteine nucleosidase